MRQIIGLTGPMGCGKSTVADELIAVGFQRVKFAAALKNMMRCIGLTDEHIEGSLKEIPCGLLGGCTPRYAMQTIGTDWGRNMISQTLWIDVWKKVVNDTPPYIHIVCDDVRFPNEADAVRDMGGTVVRIVRGTRADITHASEAMNFDADVEITNNGTIGELQDKALALTHPNRVTTEV